MKKNLDKIILSLLMSLLAWYFIDSSSNIEKEYWGKIKYINLSPNTVLIKPVNKMKFLVVTNKYQSDNFDVSDIYFEISLKDLKAGTYSIEAELKSKSPGLHTLQIKIPKNKVKVVIDDKIEKKVSIKPSITNPQEATTIIKYFDFKPEFVTLSGPLTIIEKINEITTEDILVDKIGSFNYKVKIKSIDDDVQITPSTIDMNIEVAQNAIIQELYLPIITINLAKGMKINKLTPKKAYVKIFGNYDNIKKVDFKDLFCYIDLKEIKNSGTYNLPIEPKKLDDIEILLLNPKKCEIEIVNME